ncbi:hypothetical protein JCM8208_002739 [Rhodotorula glutinis]
MADSHSPLVLPAPPPPPPAAPVADHGRPLSVASDGSAQTLRPSAAAVEHAGELKEVNVDDLTREISDLSTLVTSLSSDLSTLLAQRDSLIASGPLATPPHLAALRTSTTSLGHSLVDVLPSALHSTSLRLTRLEALAQQGAVAALDAELRTLREGLLTAQADASRIEKDVRTSAWDEVDARESAKRRLEERVRAENGGLAEEQVLEAVRSAFVEAQKRVAELDVLSYAGRVALENPATELAQLLDDAGDARSLARTDTRFSAATTLVDPFADSSGIPGDGYGYGKPENEHDLGGGGGEDGERQPLARMATSSTGGPSGRGDEEALVGGVGGGGQRKFGRWTMLQMHWRDYLLRLGLLFSSVGLVVGVVVYQSIAQRRQNEEALSSLASNPSLPAVTSS